MDLGKAIKDLRKQKGLSQKELADKAGITQAALSQIENGQRPGTETVKSICSALEISEPFLYVLGIEQEDVPEKNNRLYQDLFPIIKELVSRIVTEEKKNDNK